MTSEETAVLGHSPLDALRLSIVEKLDRKVKAKGGTENAITILNAPEGDALLDTIADHLVTAELKTRDHFPVTIDYGLSLDEMIAESGLNRYPSEISTSNFPIIGTGVVKDEVILVQFDRYMHSTEVIIELHKFGLEPATLVHALAFSSKYPEIQRRFEIVFLGSTCTIGEYRHVPKLTGGASRVLCLDFFDGDWNYYYRFAAVRMKKVEQQDDDSEGVVSAET